MDLLEAIYGRRSIRKFKKEKIPRNILNKIFEIGVQAPSSCNQQMFYFVVVDNDKIKLRLEKEAGFKWINRIPTPLFVLVDKRFGNEKFANIQGASAVIQNMLLYTYSIGIGSCWIAGYGDKAVVKNLLNVPSYFHILGCVGFGYPDEKPIVPIKRDIGEIAFYNKVNFPEKKSNNPDNWSYEDVIGLASRTIFAKSPDIGYYHLFPLELKNQLKYISNYIGKKVLYFDDVSGIYLFKLASLKPNSKFFMISSSEKVIEWMEEKRNFHKLDNINFIYSKNLDIGKSDFDTVLCLDQLNRLPSKNRYELILKCRKALKSDGNLIVSFLNKNSFYGYLFRKGVGRRYGPEISLPWSHIVDILKDNKFNIVKRTGFNLLPSFRLFFKMGVPGRYTFFNKYLRYLSKYDLQEDSVSGGFFARFSTTNIIIAKK